MNRLPDARRTEVLLMLCQGASMRGVARASGVSVNTAAKLLADAGRVCGVLDGQLIRGLSIGRVECLKSWSRGCGAEGGVWTWSAVTPVNDLVLTWRVGGLDQQTAQSFLAEIGRRTGRLATVSPAELAAACADGEPFALDLDRSRIQTADRQSAGVAKRIRARRFTRLRNAYSRRFDTFIHMVALYTFWSNFMKMGPDAQTPAMAAGLAERAWTPRDIFALIDDPVFTADTAPAPRPPPRGTG